MSKLTKVLLLTVGLMLFFGSASLAQDIPEEVQMDETVEASDLGISEPTLLPDNPFYFLKNWGRVVRSFFTFGKVNKANLRLRYASEKLLEARKLAEKVKDPEIIKKAAESYEKEVNRIKEITEKIKEKAAQNLKVEKFLDKFTKHTFLHQKILEKLEEQVPVGVQERIRETRENHLQRFGEIMEKLEEKTKISERLEKNLQEIIKKRPKIRERLENVRERILEKIEKRLIK